MFRELIGDFNKNDIVIKEELKKDLAEIEENPLCASENESNKEPDYDQLAAV